MNEDESNLIIEIVDKRTGLDISIEHETVVLLIGRPDLIGIMAHFYLFAQEDCGLKFATQKELAKKIGLSEPTFKARREELVKLGLISTSRMHKKITYKLLGLRDSELTNEPFRDDFKLILQEPKKEVKEEIVKFPNENYILVLDAFNKAKGIELAGPEIARAKHAIKQMFLANRKPEQIVACIQFFASKQNNEQYRWMSHWTLETVMKKMPEFVAGKLKVFELGDDLPEL